MEHIYGIVHPIQSTQGFEKREEALHTCDHCGQEVRPQRLLSSGRYVPGVCRCRQEAKERANMLRVLQMYTYCWLGRLIPDDLPLVEKTFENFRPTRSVLDRETGKTQFVNLTDAYDTCREFAVDLTGTLILYGDFGVGKTHLLAALINELLLRGELCRFMTATKFFDAVQERIAEGSGYHELLRQVYSPKLLVIDDVDKAKWTEWREELYFKVVNERANRELPIALSTNRVKDLPLFVGGAVTSRLSIGQIAIEMTGPDYRKEL